MRIKRISNNKYVVSEDLDFKATLIMNPRNSIVSVTITKLPADAQRQQEIFKTFSDLLTYRVGGNIILQLPPNVQSDYFPATTTMENGRYIDFATLRTVVEEMQGKYVVEEHLENCSSDSEYYALLQKPEDYTGLYEKLYKFKQDNAHTFVNPRKEEQGIYSAHAEKEKIQNPHVTHFAIYDRKRKRFIATLAVFEHGDMAHIYDLIVDKFERGMKLSQALITQAFATFANKNLKGVWLIEPTDGTPSERQYFYSTLLKSVAINPKLQLELGIRTQSIFPCRILLDAANRDPKWPHNSLDKTESSMGLLTFGLFGVVAVTAVGAAVYYCASKVETPKP